MPVDHIRYDILVQEALRGMVRDVLTEAAKNKGMPGEHHFFITFDTTAEDVRLSDRLRAQYPEEMTIVLQHQFWDLKVTDEAFEVGLSFGGVAERLVVPFEAIKAFADPSVQFTLQFETLAEAPDEDADAEEAETPTSRRRASGGAARQQPAGTSVPASPLPAARRIRRTAAGPAARQARRQGRRRSRAARPLPQEVMAKRPSDHEAARKARTRTETDTFGPIEVPADRYWGAQTQRSIENFRIGTERMPRPLIRALGIVKRAAAEVNHSLKLLDARRMRAIVKAAQEVIDGKLDDHFPLVVWQTGSGTQTNMNVNEVIANRANEMLGGKLGAKSPVHPNDHVNMSQSSNDCFPTAMHIAAAEEIARLLDPALAHLQDALQKKSQGVRADRQDRPHPHAGRDAAHARPGILRLCRAGRERHRPQSPGAQGALSAGAGRHRRRHRPERASALRRAVRQEGRRDHPAAVHQRHEQVRGAGLARRLCLRARRAERARHRSVQDRQRHPPARLRPAFGPRRIDPAGERARLLDHARQGQSDAGRSADDGVLPGVRQPHHDHRSARARAISSSTSTSRCSPHDMLQSIRLLADAARSFTDNCVVGIKADEKRIRELMERSLMLVTALAPKIGYDKAAEIAKTAHENGTTLREEAVRLGYLTGAEFDRLVRPERMTRPG